MIHFAWDVWVCTHNSGSCSIYAHGLLGYTPIRCRAMVIEPKMSSLRQSRCSGQVQHTGYTATITQVPAAAMAVRYNYCRSGATAVLTAYKVRWYHTGNQLCNVLQWLCGFLFPRNGKLLLMSGYEFTSMFVAVNLKKLTEHKGIAYGQSLAGVLCSWLISPVYRVTFWAIMNETHEVTQDAWCVRFTMRTIVVQCCTCPTSHVIDNEHARQEVACSTAWILAVQDVVLNWNMKGWVYIQGYIYITTLEHAHTIMFAVPLAISN